MNLTLSQAFERTKDLAGAIKAARAHEADCAADHEAKQRIASIAGEAHEKATAHCIELEQEREQLADHIAALVRKTGEPLEAHEAEASNVQKVHTDPQHPDWVSPDGNGFNSIFNSIFTEPADFQAQALQNGAERIEQAFRDAT